MDLNYSAEEAAFRDEVRGWLAQNLPHDLRDKVRDYKELSKDDLERWHKILARKGWVAPDWPVEWGGTGWNVVQRYIFEEECGYAGCPPLVAFGLRMCAPVLFRFGTDAQKRRHLPAIVRVALPYHAGFYLPLAVLHASLALRVAGGLAGPAELRTWGAAGNAACLALFIATMAATAWAGRKKNP